MKLLVSVKNVEEAEKVASGAVDIIDIKNPEEGSLGASYPWIISDIANKYRNTFKVSAAGGDMPDLPGMASLVARGLAYCKLDFIKIGLFGPESKDEAVFLLERVKKAVSEVDKYCKVIGVGYADYKNFNGIPVSVIPAICNEADVDGVMIDTKVKDGTGLFDILTEAELEKFINSGKKSGLITALAGSLQQKDIETIKKIQPDIIGVRSAVCDNFDRKKSINTDLVRKIKISIKETA